MIPSARMVIVRELRVFRQLNRRGGNKAGNDSESIAFPIRVGVMKRGKTTRKIGKHLQRRARRTRYAPIVHV